jgi:hypothetical protein
MVTGYEAKYYADISKIAHLMEAILLELVEIKKSLKEKN